MKYLIYFLAIIILLALNLGLFPAFSFFGAAPNFLFLFSFLSALEKKDYDFYFVALVSGLFLDFYSGLYIGSFTLGLVFLGLLLNFLIQNYIVSDVSWTRMIFMVSAGLIFLNLFLWAYNAAFFKFGFAGSSVEVQSLIARFPSELIYNLIFILPVYLFLERLKEFMTKMDFYFRRHA